LVYFSIFLLSTENTFECEISFQNYIMFKNIEALD
jgi:hypothetical protein